MDKAIFKFMGLTAAFIGRPAIMITGAVGGALPAAMVAGGIAAGLYLASRLLPADGDSDRTPEKY